MTTGRINQVAIVFILLPHALSAETDQTTPFKAQAPTWYGKFKKCLELFSSIGVSASNELFINPSE
jgi:hypothetical protein